MKKWHYRGRGITSIEVVIGVSIAGIVLVYAMYAITQFINSARDVGIRTQALYLAEDGLELVRYMRDKNWTTFSTIPLNTTRYLTITSTDILPTTTTETIGNFTRSFQVSNVYRNTTTDDIVASTTGGSAADTESKYVTMTVSWGTAGETLSLSTILVNLNP
jgi:type II secretory pathway pseudopilin PulG